MKITKLLFFVFVLTPLSFFAQEATTSPLIQHPTTPLDSTQMEALLTQAKAYIEQKDFQLALEKLALAYEINEPYDIEDYNNNQDYARIIDELIAQKIITQLPLDNSKLIIRSLYSKIHSPKFYNLLSWITVETYRSKFSIELAKKALLLSQESQDKVQIALAYWGLGYVYKWLRDPNNSLPFLLKNLEMARTINDSTILAHALYSLGDVNVNIWELNKSEKYLQEAISIASSLKNKRSLHRSLLYLKELALLRLNMEKVTNIEQQIKSVGFVNPNDYSNNGISGEGLREQGKYREAITLHKKNLEYFKSIGWLNQLCSVYRDLAISYEELGILDTAVIYYNEAIDYGRKYNDYFVLADCYRRIFKLYIEIGDTRSTKKYLNQFEDMLFHYKLQWYPYTASYYYYGKNLIAKHRGQKDSIIYYTKKNLESLQENRINQHIAIHLNELGGAYLAAGDLVKAYQQTLKALQINQKSNQEKEVLKNLILLTKITIQQGVIDSALVYAQKSYDLIQKNQNLGSIVEVYELLATVNEQVGDYQKAFKYQNLITQTKDSLLGFPQYKQIANYHSKIRLQEKELEKKQLQLEKEALLSLSQKRNFMILGLIGLVILILIIAYIIKEKTKINAQRDLRAQITKDIHDDVGGIINNLKITAKEALEQKADAQLVEQKLNETIQLGQAALKSLKDLVWKLENQQTTLQQFKEEVTNFSEKMFAITNTTYQLGFSGFKTASTLSPKIYHHVLMIYKETLQNIIKHGERKGIQIDWQYNKQQLQLNVENPIAKHSNDSKDIALSHNGLQNIKKRAHLINGTAAFKKEKNNFSVSVTITL